LEKFRQCRTQRAGHDQLRGRQGGIHGAQPTAEKAPDFGRVIQCQVLKQSLRDAAQLHMQVKGIHLAEDGVAIGLAFAVQILISLSAAAGLHGGHPEMVCITSHDMHGLPEAQLDFEAVAIEQDDFHRLQSQIGGQQEDGAAQRMMDDNKTHQPSRRPPQQIDGAIVQRNILLAIDGAGRGEKLALVADQ